MTLQSHAFADPDAALPEPVAVTRWSARLSDRACERDYLLQRFADDRARALLLMCVVSAAGALIFLGRFYAYVHGAGSALALLPPLASTFLPLLATLVFRRMRTPRTLEIAMIVAVSIGTSIRLTMLSLQPDMLAMWLPMMVTTLFVVYLYLPVRFVSSVALAAAFSVGALLACALIQYPGVAGEEIWRGALWLLLANALGFTAANALQRGQRIQYAQSLVLRQLLSTDALTGIANRRHFDDVLALEWRRSARAGVPLSLLMIDVDHFKAYNDHCGHQRGDDCLRRVARLLLNSVGRPADLVARYGGEEFVCLLPGADEVSAQAVAARLLRAVRAAAIAHPRSPSASRLTISIGAATAFDLAETPDALVALADRLLYAAKDAGRDRVIAGTIGQGSVFVPPEKIALAG